MDNNLIKLILHKKRFSIWEIKVNKVAFLKVIRIMHLKGGEINKVKVLGRNRMPTHLTGNPFSAATTILFNSR